MSEFDQIQPKLVNGETKPDGVNEQMQEIASHASTLFDKAADWQYPAVPDANTWQYDKTRHQSYRTIYANGSDLDPANLAGVTCSITRWRGEKQEEPFDHTVTISRSDYNGGSVTSTELAVSFRHNQEPETILGQETGKEGRSGQLFVISKAEEEISPEQAVPKLRKALEVIDFSLNKYTQSVHDQANSTNETIDKMRIHAARTAHSNLETYAATHPKASLPTGALDLL